MTPIYQATATSTGGREGRSSSNDNRLNIALSTPKELGGPGGEGTNPEQLFAAGYSACFIGALKYVAAEQAVTIPVDISVEATVGIGNHPSGVGFAISVDLKVTIPGLENETTQKLIDAAHQVCPYSNAIRGNVEVSTTIA